MWKASSDSNQCATRKSVCVCIPLRILSNLHIRAHAENVYIITLFNIKLKMGVVANKLMADGRLQVNMIRPLFKHVKLFSYCTTWTRSIDRQPKRKWAEHSHWDRHIRSDDDRYMYTASIWPHHEINIKDYAMDVFFQRKIM